MLAALDAGLAPERVSEDPEVRRGGCGSGIERLVLVPRPGGHDQRSGRAERVADGGDETSGPTLHRPGGAKRSVNQEHALPDPQATKLLPNLGLAQHSDNLL